MRIEKCENGYFAETIHATWVFTDFKELMAFVRDAWGLDSELGENSEE